MKKNCIVLAICVALPIIGCKSDGGGKGDSGIDAGQSACPWDEDDIQSKASSLDFDSPAQGYLCPIGDQDWYSFSIPDGIDLLSVSLSIDAPVTAVNLTYGVWTSTNDEVVVSPESSESAEPNNPIEITHGMQPGDYFVVVRDRASDAEDVYHPYELTISGHVDPDVNEPNNTMEDATELGAGSVEGYVSYRGDEDWYRIDVQDHELVGINLTMPTGGIEPAYRMVNADGDLLVAGSNEAGQFEDTLLHYMQAVETAGAYYVVVSDDDNLEFDFEVPYILELTITPDPDPNETNDHPNQATPMTSLNCSATTWSSWVDVQGYIASSGDMDWFSLDISSSSKCIMDVEVQFENETSLPDEFQVSARIGRDSNTYLCDNDQDCLELPRTCQINLGCAWFGNNCLSVGVCAGGGACLSSGNCMVDYYAEYAPETIPDPGDPSADIVNPDRGTVGFATILIGSTPPYLIGVSDYHGDSYSMSHQYTLRVRVRKDPDTTEHNEAFAAGPPGPETEEEAAIHATNAVEVPVHDCDPAPDAGAPDCCNSGTWEEAYLSYKYDQDWFKYQHPCPDEDCMVRFVYDLDPGEVDVYVQVYDGDTPWFDNLCDIADTGSHAALSGYFGGLGASDYCFYAWQGHTGTPFWYYLAIRDTIYVSEGHEDEGTWDWSSDQAYRFCVEKVANGCQEPPCQLYGDAGCGSPSS